MNVMYEQMQDVLKSTEYLAHINSVYLGGHEQTPALQDSGVQLREGVSNMVSDIPRMLKERTGEYESLIAWRIAELRRVGVAAKPYLLKPVGQKHYTIAIRLLLSGQFEMLGRDGRFELKTESELFVAMRDGE